MTMQQIPVILAWTAAAVLLAIYAASIASEITYVTLADGRKTERKIPLIFRLLLPFVSNLSRVVNRPAFAKSRETADQMIVASGLEGLLSGSEFIALKILVPFVCGSAWALAVFAPVMLDAETFLSGNTVLIAMLGFLYFYAYPLMWLRNTLKKRHFAIMRALPFVLDLLTLSVEAGMDFMSALQRNCNSRRLDPLNEELLRVPGIGEKRLAAIRDLVVLDDQG
jgi:tight adherence protein C